MKKALREQCFFGAGGGTRTRDLLITNQLLYQLSHTSAKSVRKRTADIITQKFQKSKSFFEKIKNSFRDDIDAVE